MQGDLFQVDKGPLMRIPVAKSGIKTETHISNKVQQVISLKKQDPSADTSALEAEIDGLVYALYGLTEEEVGVVEGGVREQQQ